MALVIVTTIVFGALMPFAVKFFRKFDPPKALQKAESELILIPNELTIDHDNEERSNFEFEFTHPNFFKK